MNKHQPLVDEAALRNTIHQLDLDDLQKDRLINRWLHYVVWWDARSRASKWKHYTLRSIVVAGGAAIPALVSAVLD